MYKKPRIQIRKYWKLFFLLIIFTAVSFGIQWITYARPPLTEALDNLESDESVEVTFEPWLTFTPKQKARNTIFIFYPGGRINPQGYAALMKNIASKGYLVVVPKMPINMAVFNPNIADEIIAQYPGINKHVIGGHSVGGTMAVQYANTHRDIIDGLVIWASYPADNADLSNTTLQVVSIYGSLDPGVNESQISSRKSLLPEGTSYIRIEGGDHHQFGSYVTKLENDHATISRDAQHEQIIASTLDLLDSVSISK